MAPLTHQSARLIFKRSLQRPHSTPATPKRQKATTNTERSSRNLPQTSKPASEPIQAKVDSAPPFPLPLHQRLGPVSIAFNAYGRTQKRRPWATQICTSLVIYFCGDMAAQRIDGEAYNPARTARHLCIGAVASVPAYSWFMYLNTLFNYPSLLLSLAAKVTLNQLLFTPIFNSYFFSMQSLLTGAYSPLEIWARIRNTVPVSFVNSCKVWPAVTAFMFAYVPAQYRALFAGVVAVGWQSYLSWLNQRAVVAEGGREGVSNV